MQIINLSLLHRLSNLKITEKCGSIIMGFSDQAEKEKEVHNPIPRRQKLFSQPTNFLSN